MGFEFSVLAKIALMHSVAVASPGSDFAIVLKHALQQGRRLAIYTSIGVGIGILVHVAYSILGIGLIIQTTPWLFDTLLYAAAGYLIFIGIGALRSSSSTTEASQSSSLKQTMSARRAFTIGFITNGLNPKATLFFLALFSLAIPTETTLLVKLIYGGYLALATATWFILVSYLASHAPIRAAYQRKGYWFDRIMGGVIILMALLLVFSN